VDVQFVEEVFQSACELLNLHVGGKIIRTTPLHPFYVRAKGWTTAAELRIGDPLRSDDGAWTPVEGVGPSGEESVVYNLRVSNHQTYFVGATGWGFSVWAHNTCAGDHHFVPRFMGSTVGYGNRILTWLNASSHTAVHKAMYPFLSARGMNWWKGQTWIVSNFGKTERLKALVDFYKSYNGGAYLKDFIIELRATVQAGRLL
jgi:hypothetical protein